MGFKGLIKNIFLLLFVTGLVFFLNVLAIPAVFAQNQCSNDIQCGFTGFFGSEFCKNDDVYKNYQTALCNEQCQVSVEERLVNDCDDGDGGTLDTCIEEENLAYCNHDLVQCVENDECGSPTEHFFCQSGDVWHQVNNPVCNTNASQCIFDSFDELYEDCQYGCNNASCIIQIACNSNADCPSPIISDNFCFSDDVVRENTSYTCVYPGSAASFCQQNTQKEIVQYCSNSCSNGHCTADNDDNDDKERGGIKNFDDLDPLFFEKKEEAIVFGSIIPPSDSNETISQVAKKGSSYADLWILFWLFLVLVLILLILVVIVLAKRR